MAETTNTNTFMGNIDLNIAKKKRFTINNDESKVLELDTSDLTVLTRLTEGTKTIETLLLKLESLETDGVAEDATEEEKTLKMVANIKRLDTEFRSIIDNIFDSNVCEVCAPSGLMFDPIDGKLRYMYILEALMNLYEENISKESKKLMKKIKSHTDKYTK